MYKTLSSDDGTLEDYRNWSSKLYGQSWTTILVSADTKTLHIKTPMRLIKAHSHIRVRRVPKEMKGLTTVTIGLRPPTEAQRAK